jgi:nucleotide-binding universal stress UspA family protein
LRLASDTAAMADSLRDDRAAPVRLRATNAGRRGAARRRQGDRHAVVAREGDPSEELLEVARAAGAHLVIVGRRGKDFVARALLGSVATRVIEHAPCDVLVGV